jgi:hypothetical protein
MDRPQRRDRQCCRLRRLGSGPTELFPEPRLALTGDRRKPGRRARQSARPLSIRLSCRAGVWRSSAKEAAKYASSERRHERAGDRDFPRGHDQGYHVIHLSRAEFTDYSGFHSDVWGNWRLNPRLPGEVEVDAIQLRWNRSRLLRRSAVSSTRGTALCGRFFRRRYPSPSG